jgi:hypothetical protein
MDSKIRQAYEDFLNPDVTRYRLIIASIYIAGFELLKDSIVNHLRSFYADGFDDTGEILGERYQSAVLRRNRSAVYASLEWMKEMQAIDDSDIAAFNRVKSCRNVLAHRLFDALGSEGLPADFDQCFTDMKALVRKIEMWWIINVEIPTDPDFDGETIDDDGIVPGAVMSMQLLLDIALGDEEQSRFYYNEFRRRTSVPDPEDSPPS